MILAHLNRHWLARRGQGTLASWMMSIVRSLRVLLYYRDHRALCQLDVYRNYVAAAGNDDLFHHLSHRDYLVKGMTARERVGCVLTHYRFEETTFNAEYKQAVYRAGGLTLWQHTAEGSSFLIRLEMAARENAEGDLTIALVADGKCLHRLSFTWVEGATVGVPAPLLPFVACNQGRWSDSGEAFEAFERAFPNNSPSFFCFSALQGVAQAVDMSQVVAVRCDGHVAYDPEQVKHFANAYDGFWKILGGVEMLSPGYLIALPFYLKPLADMPSKHRKRAALRREQWRAIGDAARSTLQRHLLHARAHVEHAAPVRESTEV
jgi:uncharacterized protein VirK/YbjX